MVALFEAAKELKDMGIGQGLGRHLAVRAACGKLGQG